MNENFKVASQEIREVINKFNLNSSDVELILINLRKETELKEFTQKLCNELPKAMQKYHFSNRSNCSDNNYEHLI